MAGPSVTYSFSNSTTADATQVNQNFADLIDGATDGTKDYSVNIMAAAGAFSAAERIVTSGISVLVATNAGSSTVADTTHIVIFAPASTIATYSLTLPAAPSDGQRLILTSGGANAITALTLAANTGHTLATGVQMLSVKQGMSMELIFKSTVWYLAGSSLRAPSPTTTKYTSGTGTYTVPTGCTAITVKMVGGGGGGGGSGTAGAGNGGTGGTTTFGSFSCPGGVGGTWSSSSFQGGGAGGTAGAASTSGIAFDGNKGQGNFDNFSSGLSYPGGTGAGSIFGSGGPGTAAANGNSPAANSGAGGGGGGIGTTADSFTGSGGGSGSGMNLMLAPPAASYSYAVGAAGTAGTAGTNGFAGGSGGAGAIYIIEFYT